MEDQNEGFIPSFSGKFVNNEQHLKLQHLVAPHVESFDYFLEYGLEESVMSITPLEFDLGPDYVIKFQYNSAQVSYPSRKDDISERKITPREARESGVTYSASLIVTLDVTINESNDPMSLSIKLGNLPIMVMSERCNLKGCSFKKLCTLKEEANEVGGYFVMNGIERVVRLLQVPRRNYAQALERSTFRNRGNLYSEKGVTMRCARPDQSSVTVTLHYLINGGATLRFVLRKQEFLLPVVLVAKALMDMTDKEFFSRIVQNDTSNTFLTTRLELLLRDFKVYKLHSKSECQAYLGSLFRGYLPVADKTMDEDAGKLLIQKYLFVHVEAFPEKLECLFHMLRKLFAFAQGRCLADNADALMNHELLLPGHLINMQIKEKMEDLMLNVKAAMLKDHRTNAQRYEKEIKSYRYFQSKFDTYGKGLADRIGTFLSTGNVVSSTGLDLMQVSGFTVVAERLNIFRYMSHFQSVHRGQYFTTMKTTTVRKLLPESWGFLCPVHTPDGSPCGLLNHLAREAVIVAHPPGKRPPITPWGPVRSVFSKDRNARASGGSSTKVVTAQSVNSRFYIQSLLVSLGLVPCGAGAGDGQLLMGGEQLPVLLDGVVLGGLAASEVPGIVTQLRLMKSYSSLQQGEDKPPADNFTPLDPTVELAYIPVSKYAGTFPGLYIFTQPGRIIRPVVQLKSRRIEWIGPLEQVYMNIACLAEDVVGQEQARRGSSDETKNF